MKIVYRDALSQVVQGDVERIIFCPWTAVIYLKDGKVMDLDRNQLQEVYMLDNEV